MSWERPIQDLENWLSGGDMKPFAYARNPDRWCSICGKPIKKDVEVLVTRAGGGFKRSATVVQVFHKPCWEFLKDFVQSIRDPHSSTKMEGGHEQGDGESTNTGLDTLSPESTQGIGLEMDAT